VDQATRQFILGRRDLSEFDTYVTELKGERMTTYMDIKNDVHGHEEQGLPGFREEAGRVRPAGSSEPAARGAGWWPNTSRRPCVWSGVQALAQAREM